MKKFIFSGILPMFVGVSVSFLTGCGSPEEVAREALEEKGYELSVKDYLSAASSGDGESIDLFIQAGMEIDSVDSGGNTALIKAAGSGRLAVVEKVLGLGADPRHANNVGRDALISASSKGFESVARMLIDRGADPSIKDSEGWGALSIASYNGHSSVVSLLAGQSSADELDDALLVASFSGDAEVIDTLLNQGANINARSPENKTPLMIAAEGGKLEIVRVFLQNQANPYAVDGENLTAANLAEREGFPEVKDLILTPDNWGSSPRGAEVIEEMELAQQALSGEGVEETLLEAPLTVSHASSEGSHSNSSPELIELSATGTLREDPAAGSITASVPSGNPSTTAASPRLKPDPRLVRSQAKTKPVVALNGSVIKATSPRQAPVKSMILAGYHEEPLPIVVDDVDGNKASMRRLDQPSGQAFEVTKGSMIPGTSFKIRDVSSKYVSSKEGKGRMVDVSRVTVENTESGATHLLVKDVAGQTSDTYAILTSPDSQFRYVVKSGDVFTTNEPGIGVREFQVLDIRANAVVIKDTTTDEVLTIARDGIVEP